MEGIRKAMNERNLNEGQWEDRKQGSLGVGQRRKTFWNRYVWTERQMLAIFEEHHKEASLKSIGRQIPSI